MSWNALAWGTVISFVLGFAVWATIACLGALAARLGLAMLKAWKEHRP
jgi:hypothetical protein